MGPGNDSCGSKCCLPYKWRWNSTDICVRFNNGINGKSQRLWKRSLQPTQTFIEEKTGFWIGSKCKFWNRKDQLLQTSHVWNCSQLLNFIRHCSKWKLSQQQVWKLLSCGPKKGGSRLQSRTGARANLWTGAFSCSGRFRRTSLWATSRAETVSNRWHFFSGVS